MFWREIRYIPKMFQPYIYLLNHLVKINVTWIFINKIIWSGFIECGKLITGLKLTQRIYNSSNNDHFVNKYSNSFMLGNFRLRYRMSHEESPGKSLLHRVFNTSRSLLLLSCRFDWSTSYRLHRLMWQLSIESHLYRYTEVVGIQWLREQFRGDERSTGHFVGKLFGYIH